jgi:hypothetical protein
MSSSWIRSVNIGGKVEEGKASTLKVSKRNLASIVNDCQFLMFLEKICSSLESIKEYSRKLDEDAHLIGELCKTNISIFRDNSAFLDVKETISSTSTAR